MKTAALAVLLAIAVCFISAWAAYARLTWKAATA